MSLEHCTRAGLLTVASLALFLADAHAGTQDGARILLHTQAPAAKGQCTSATPGAQGIPCSEFLTAAATGSSYHVYLVVAGADPGAGIGGLSCGIDYNPASQEGVDVLGWTLCSEGLDFRNAGPYGIWPEAQGGIRITWDQSANCQRTVIGEEGVQATAGYFYVYAYGADTLRVVRNENLKSGPEVGVGDCEAEFTPLPYEALGRVVFSEGGETPGCNPCLEPCPDPPPPRKAECLFDPPEIDFGYVPVGEERDTSLVLTNVGNAPMAVAAYRPSSCYSMVHLGGAGEYALLPGDSQTFIVSFNAYREAYCSLQLRILPCDGVLVTGVATADPPPPPTDCVLVPPAIEFPPTFVGESRNELFRIFNPNLGTLAGAVQVDCVGLSLIGAPTYILGHQQTYLAILHFAPDHPGTYPCQIVLDPPCEPIPVVARAGLAKEVTLDILPGICPNTLLTRPGRQVEVVVLGSESFDPTLVETPTLRMNYGAAPRSVQVADIAQPGLGAPGTVPLASGEDCTCTDAGLSPDGYPDLTLVFDVRDLAAVYDPNQGSEGTLQLTAMFSDTLIIVGSDCVRWEELPLAHGPAIVPVDEAGTGPAGSLSLVLEPEGRSRQRITYTLPEAGRVELLVFDVAGRRVAKLQDGVEAAGRRALEWDSASLPSGIYFYRLETERGTRTQKALLLH